MSEQTVRFATKLIHQMGYRNWLIEGVDSSGKTTFIKKILPKVIGEFMTVSLGKAHISLMTQADPGHVSEMRSFGCFNFQPFSNFVRFCGGENRAVIESIRENQEVVPLESEASVIDRTNLFNLHKRHMSLSAKRMCETPPLVFDRTIYGELVYGTLYRNYPVLQNLRMLDGVPTKSPFILLEADTDKDDGDTIDILNREFEMKMFRAIQADMREFGHPTATIKMTRSFNNWKTPDEIICDLAEQLT